MKLKPKFVNDSIGGIIGASLVFLLGLALWNPLWDIDIPIKWPEFPMAIRMTRASYDWSFELSKFARPDLQSSEVVIVYIDEDSLRSLGQSLTTPMDRSLHAKLLNKLKAEGAKAVVMDMIFSDPGPDELSDKLFTEALRSNGKVILADDYAQLPTSSNRGVASFKYQTITPYAPFEKASLTNGLDALAKEDDFLVRRHSHTPPSPGDPPSLSWVTAQTVGLKLTRNPREQAVERWMYYYGPPETIPHVNYQQALSENGVQPGFFRNRIVFIGGRPRVGALAEKRDEMRSPYSTANRLFNFMPLVEIHATQLLNLLRGDWVTRPTPVVEIGVLALAAFIFGFGFLRFRPPVATGLAVASMLVVILIAQSLFVQQRIWFPWLVIVAAQIPLALLWSVIYRSLQWYV
ncbi:MAG: putative Histidine kinase, partial [Pedosphaera sp.]|nr:putative Histidine kinase [Pedosphaera sp.]